MCLPLLLAAATIQGRRLFRSRASDCVATIRGQPLFEGGIYSKKCSMQINFMFKLQLSQSSAFQPHLHNPELKEIHNELVEVTEWFQLGVQLGVPLFKLKAIKNDYPQNQHREVEMLDFWCCNTAEVSWIELAKAVKEMGYVVLAEKLRRKAFHLSLPLNTTVCLYKAGARKGLVQFLYMPGIVCIHSCGRNGICSSGRKIEKKNIPRLGTL